MNLSEMLKRAHKNIGTPPCEMGLCSARRIDLCADNSIGCQAWRHYVAKGKISTQKIGQFKDSICSKCKKEKSGCVRKCKRMKA